MAAPRHIVVMGVSGNGKTTIGTWLATELDRTFIEGDDFHPPENVAKMSSGQALDDADRRPWLATLAGEIRRHEEESRQTVTGCSALRRTYRDWLRAGWPALYFVHLVGSYDLILERMHRRRHFMPPSLLTSQFEALEPLEDDELGVAVDVKAPPDQIVSTVLASMSEA